MCSRTRNVGQCWEYLARPRPRYDAWSLAVWGFGRQHLKCGERVGSRVQLVRSAVEKKEYQPIRWLQLRLSVVGWTSQNSKLLGLRKSPSHTFHGSVSPSLSLRVSCAKTQISHHFTSSVKSELDMTRLQMADYESMSGNTKHRCKLYWLVMVCPCLSMVCFPSAKMITTCDDWEVRPLVDPHCGLFFRVFPRTVPKWALGLVFSSAYIRWSCFLDVAMSYSHHQRSILREGNLHRAVSNTMVDRFEFMSRWMEKKLWTRQIFTKHKGVIPRGVQHSRIEASLCWFASW